MDGTLLCERCGNAYDKPLVIRTYDDESEHVFDSFECAIDMLAPRCENCGCRIIGHGLEDQGQMFCCASCARQVGAVRVVADRGDTVNVGPGRDAQAFEPAAAPRRPPSDS